MGTPGFTLSGSQPESCRHHTWVKWQSFHTADPYSLIHGPSMAGSMPLPRSKIKITHRVGVEELGQNLRCALRRTSTKSGGSVDRGGGGRQRREDTTRVKTDNVSTKCTATSRNSNSRNERQPGSRCTLISPLSSWSAPFSRRGNTAIFLLKKRGRTELTNPLQRQFPSTAGTLAGGCCGGRRSRLLDSRE